MDDEEARTSSPYAPTPATRIDGGHVGAVVGTVIGAGGAVAAVATGVGFLGLVLGPMLPVLGGFAGAQLARSTTRLVSAVRDLRYARAARRARQRAGEVVPIGRAPEGLVRVRGRVRLLFSLHTPVTAEPCGAFLTRSTVHEACQCGREGCERTFTREMEERQCGRFVVEDESGVAVVDAAYFVLVPRQRSWGGSLVVGPDARVEVAGPARREPVHDVGAPSAPSYRGSALPLVFRGTADDPVVIWCDAAGSSA